MDTMAKFNIHFSNYERRSASALASQLGMCLLALSQMGTYIYLTAGATSYESMAKNL